MVSVRSDGILIGSAPIHLQRLERFEHVLCFVIGTFYKGTHWRVFVNNQMTELHIKRGVENYEMFQLNHRDVFMDL